MALKVIIDSGHGGSDPGASGNGIIEKNMTLDISKAMYDELKKLGIPVYMTRTDDTTLNPTDRTNKVKSFVKPGDDVVVISNHINAGGGEGAEVIYALRNNEKLSQKILNELASSGQIIRKYYQKRGTSDPNSDYYYMLRNTAPYESVIVEYGFLDNAKDASKLKNNYKQYALDVVDAVLDYKGYIPNDVDYYIVKKGDSLYSIAKKYGTTVDKLKALNNLTSNNLSIGQSLLVKDNVEGTIPEPPVGDYYTVKRGDTLYGIANMYSMSVNELKSLNNLTSDTLSLGQVLKVKQGTTPEEPKYENVYVVKPGDTLYSIANKNNTNINTLMELNNLSSSMISVNQKLILPSKNYYTVQKGDTLYAIASKYNTNVDTIKDLNNLSSNLLSIGQKLIVP